MSLALGVLAAVSPGAAVAAVAVLLVAVATRLRRQPVFLIAAAFVLAIPTGWGMSRTVPFLNVGLGFGTVALPVALAMAAVGLYLFSGAFETTAAHRRTEGLAVWYRLLLIWLAVVVVSLAYGASRWGLRDAFSDGQVYLLYSAMLLPLLTPGAWRRLGADKVVLLALVSLAAYSVWVLAVLVVGGLHESVYGGTAMERTRVGFATTSLMVLFIPMGVAALGSPTMKMRSRALVWACIGLMSLSVIVAQSRSVLAGLLAGVAIVLLWPWSTEVSRSRKLTSLLLVGTLGAVGLGVVASSPDLLSAVNSFSSRGQIGASDPSYQTRLLTYSALWTRLSTTGGLLAGLGIGSTAPVIAPSGAVVSEYYFIDNTVLTVILKSGIVGAAILCSLLAAVWAYAYRSARRGGVYARAAVASLPFFLGVTGLSSAQLVNAASVPVGLAIVAAVLIAEGGTATEPTDEAGGGA
jgi:hypothetical protein